MWARVGDMAVEIVNGVVLGVLPYGERGLVAQLYTYEQGRVAVISQAGKARDGSKVHAYFRALAILRLQVRPSRHTTTMLQLAGVEDFVHLANLHADYERGAVAYLIGELLQCLLFEPVSHGEIYDFLTQRVALLSAVAADAVTFLMVFMLDLSEILGYAPRGQCTAETPAFNLRTGCFCGELSVESPHGIPNHDAVIWGKILAERYGVDLRGVGSAQRYRVIQQELRYLEIYSGRRLQLKSLFVLREMLAC